MNTNLKSSIYLKKIFYNIINVYQLLLFDQFNASLQNKSIVSINNNNLK